MTTISDHIDTRPSAGEAAGPRLGTGWARCGIGGGVLGLAVFMMTGPLNVEESALADNAEIAAAVTDEAVWVWAYQVVGVAAALLIAVFAAGLYRRLAQQSPAQSLAPMVSAAGLWLVSALGLVGSGISTEMFHGLRQDTDALDPDTLAAQLAIYNTMGWVWIGAVLATGAIAGVGLKHGSVSRALAIGSLVATVLMAITNITPFQYMAMPIAAIWMIGAGISFARTER